MTPLKYLLKRVLKQFVPEENLTNEIGVLRPSVIGFAVRCNRSCARLCALREALSRGLFNQRQREDADRSACNGTGDAGISLWSLLMLELWFSRFID